MYISQIDSGFVGKTKIFFFELSDITTICGTVVGQKFHAQNLVLGSAETALTLKI